METTGGRLLALDVGTLRIGVAVCDALRVVASPLTTVQRQSVARDSVEIAEIASREGVGGVIVGLPLGLDGGETRSTRLARQIGEAVAAVEKTTGMHADDQTAKGVVGFVERRRPRPRVRISTSFS